LIFLEHKDTHRIDIIDEHNMIYLKHKRHNLTLT
jgi:hypothetical protein